MFEDAIIAQAHLLPGITYCLITSANHSLRYMWIPILGYDSMLLVLFLYKGYQSYSIHKRRNRFGVMTMVYERSLLNFLAYVLLPTYLGVQESH